MKTKKMKLSLQKITISNLTDKSLQAIQGGRTEQGITIPPCTDDCGTIGCPPPTDTCIPCDSNPNYITCIKCL
jgi:hypothetical protein